MGFLSERFSNYHYLDEDEFSKIRKEREASGLPIHDLTITNPTLVGLEFPSLVLKSTLEHSSSKYSPDPRGSRKARASISQYYREKNILFEEEDLFLTSGTAESFSQIFKLLLNPGDGVLIPNPCYPLFEVLAEMELVETVPYELDQETGKITRESLENAYSPNCKIFVLIEPHNPIGNILDETEVGIVFEFCKAHNLALVIDEVFRDYRILAEERFPSQRFHDSTTDLSIFTLNGASKTLGLPGAKMAWFHVKLAQRLQNQKKSIYHSIELILDNILSLNSFSQECFPTWMEWRNTIQNQINSRIKRNAYACLEVFPENTQIPEAGWFQKISLLGANCLELAKYEGIFLFSGSVFGFSPNQNLGIISLITPEIELRNALEKIHKYIKK